jgi:hypothetical protein
MICRLFIFSEECNLNLNLEPSKKDCSFCQSADSCVNCEELSEKLTSDKYSWIVSRKFSLPEEYHEKCRLVGFQSAIRLVHPSSSAVWLIQLKNDNEYSYAVIVGKSKTGAKTISQLNFDLKKTHDYDGRDITVEDFQHG